MSVSVLTPSVQTASTVTSSRLLKVLKGKILPTSEKYCIFRAMLMCIAYLTKTAENSLSDGL